MVLQTDNLPKTIGELKKFGYRTVSIKDELRNNMLRKLKSKEDLFPGIIGYEKTVIPQLVNAILAKHNILLLGLRGQAKSRLMRMMTRFLDDKIPVIAGCPINDDPFAPLCKKCRTTVTRMGDETYVEWLTPEQRYNEKLATPDITVADLIGDIDPIKAATRKLELADEEVINFGIIPRTNRGIFGINELPDLNTRIQVSLLNILEERDIQIRGFPVRLNLDIMFLFSANPEDYTNRGKIITPLKDRIESQISTHYPVNIEDSIAITKQEAWLVRDSGVKVHIPEYIYEVVERATIAARENEFVDQASGVSARMSIAAIECIMSNIERRALLNGETQAFPRVSDIYYALPAILGKIELVYEGEQKGATVVAKKIVGAALNQLFLKYFPAYHKPGTSKRTRHEQGKQEEEVTEYQDIIRWFSKGGIIVLSNDSPFHNYIGEMKRVHGLEEMVMEKMGKQSELERAFFMELVLEGLYQNSAIAREDLPNKVSYKDILETMLDSME